VPLEGCFPLAPSYDHGGPMALDVRSCVEMLRVMAPEFEPASLGSLEDVEVGIAWLETADPLVRASVEAAAALFPRRRMLDFPLPGAIGPVFMREAADVHRELYAEHSELYGENVSIKVERCLAVTDGEYEAALRLRQEYRERAAEALEGVDVLVTPTIGMVAPPLGLSEFDLRERTIRFTIPFNALGWPALALPCGPAEGGLPASVQVVGRAGADGLVLAAGALLEEGLAD
jgi:Asp-tRNA(Asn)/Glu-tRNA(Gln) amidotransferase A subunit family amidase